MWGMQLRRRFGPGDRGFTLIELIVVITVILILLGIALPIYTQSVIAQREYNLRQNLRTLNQTIDQYTLDKKKAPQSLEDLKSAGYIDFIPEDITGRTDTWELVQDDSIKTVEQSDPGVSAVHSGSDRVSSDGTVYSSW
jgi:general secretion pathway protein G